MSKCAYRLFSNHHPEPDTAPKYEGKYVRVLGWCKFPAGEEVRTVVLQKDGTWLSECRIVQNVLAWQPVPPMDKLPYKTCPQCKCKLDH